MLAGRTVRSTCQLRMTFLAEGGRVGRVGGTQLCIHDPFEESILTSIRDKEAWERRRRTDGKATRRDDVGCPGSRKDERWQVLSLPTLERQDLGTHWTSGPVESVAPDPGDHPWEFGRDPYLRNCQLPYRPCHPHGSCGVAAMAPGSEGEAWGLEKGPRGLLGFCLGPVKLARKRSASLHVY